MCEKSTSWKDKVTVSKDQRSKVGFFKDSNRVTTGLTQASVMKTAPCPVSKLKLNDHIMKEASKIKITWPITDNTKVTSKPQDIFYVLSILGITNLNSYTSVEDLDYLRAEATGWKILLALKPSHNWISKWLAFLIFTNEVWWGIFGMVFIFSWAILKLSSNPARHLGATFHSKRLCL